MGAEVPVGNVGAVFASIDVAAWWPRGEAAVDLIPLQHFRMLVAGMPSSFSERTAAACPQRQTSQGARCRRSQGARTAARLAGAKLQEEAAQWRP